MRLQSTRRTAFTLVELLVVIAIIGVLVGLLLPAVQAARESGRRTQCSNQIRQLGLAVQQFHDANNVLPAGGKINGNQLSWLVSILPYIEQKAVYDDMKVDSNVAGYVNYLIAGQNNQPARLKLLICPSATTASGTSLFTGAGYLETLGGVAGAPAYATTHYYGVMGPIGPDPERANPAFYKTNSTTSPLTPTMPVGSPETSIEGVLGTDLYSFGFNDVLDGLSNTFLAGELSWADSNVYRAWIVGCPTISGAVQCASCKNIVFPIKSQALTSTGQTGWKALNIAAGPQTWTAGANDVSFGSNHPGGCHFVMCDGSVKFVTENTDIIVLLATASMNGKETKVLR